jgi:hypothetical protein
MTGVVPFLPCTTVNMLVDTGVLAYQTNESTLRMAATENAASGNPIFDASRQVPTAAENRPVNIAIPCILYLGRSAQV